MTCHITSSLGRAIKQYTMKISQVTPSKSSPGTIEYRHEIEINHHQTERK